MSVIDHEQRGESAIDSVKAHVILTNGQIAELRREVKDLKHQLNVSKQRSPDHSVDVTDMIASPPLATLRLSELSGLSDGEIKDCVNEFALPGELEAWKTAANQLADALALLDAPGRMTGDEAEKLGRAIEHANEIIAAREGH